MPASALGQKVDAPPTLPFVASIHRDLISAYIASAAKVGSWMVVLALAYRAGGAMGLGTLALARSSLSLLNYTSLGIGQAMVAWGAATRRIVPKERHTGAGTGAGAGAGTGTVALSDAPAGTPTRHRAHLSDLYCSAVTLGFAAAAFGMVLAFLYAVFFDAIHDIRGTTANDALVLWLGVGLLLRQWGEIPGACLQLEGRLSTDYLIQAAAELSWILLCLQSSNSNWDEPQLAFYFAASGLVAAVLRSIAAYRFTGPYRPWWTRRAIVAGLFGYSVWISLGALADFLHAPMNHVLLSWSMSTFAVAYYSAAVQIDSALLLLVAALASTIFPRSSRAYAAGDMNALRRQYLLGTFASIALLTTAATVVYLISPWLFPVWFGRDLPETRKILPLVLLHTVVGGSAGVGRSVLIATGRAAAYTISAFVAGLLNLLLCYVFLEHLKWGIAGVALATIIVVTARCALWMPWYTLRVIRIGTRETAVPAIEPVDGETSTAL